MEWKDMSPDDLRNAWRKSAERIQSPCPLMKTCCDIDALMSRQTSQQRLVRNYRRFSIISCLMTFSSTLFYYSEIFPQSGRIVVTLLLIFYFGICCGMDYWLYKKTSSINIYDMSVEAVATIANLCRRRHQQFMLVLIPYAAVLLGVFIYFPLKEGEDGLWYGAVAGGIVGGCIGFRKYLEIMRDYRHLSDE